MIKFPILNIEGKEVDSMSIPKELLGGPINQDVMHQAIVMYQACLRQGNASIKDRGEVSGGGKKPFKQKGTGRARAGSTRSPLWAGGGVVHGPQPRDFGYTIPKKIKAAALKESLNSKYHEKDILCLEDLKSPLSKTKEFSKILKTLKLGGKILALLDGSDPSIEKVSRNIASLHFMRSQDVNAYDILRNKKILTTRSALKKLLERIKE